jgi:hypothetical protein
LARRDDTISLRQSGKTGGRVHFSLHPIMPISKLHTPLIVSAEQFFSRLQKTLLARVPLCGGEKKFDGVVGRVETIRFCDGKVLDLENGNNNDKISRKIRVPHRNLEHVFWLLESFRADEIIYNTYSSPKAFEHMHFRL